MRDVSRSTDSPGGLFYVPAWCAGAVVQPPPILHGTYIDLGIPTERMSSRRRNMNDKVNVRYRTQLICIKATGLSPPHVSSTAGVRASRDGSGEGR